MLEVKDFTLLTVVVWSILMLFVSVEAKHYRGGTIYWSPVDDNPDQVSIQFDNLDLDQNR